MTPNAATHPDGIHSPGHVLIVDDELVNRSILRAALEEWGYQVSEACNGEIALQEVALNPPDVILADVMMPVMDGFEACRRLKGDPRTAPIPVLIVTSLDARKERLNGIAAGANDFLIKPIDLEEMRLRVRNSVQIKRLYDQLEQSLNSLREEQEKSERLLLNILPGAIAARLKKGESTIADHFPEVTVLFADITGFTELAAKTSPAEIVRLLNEIFSALDTLAEKNNLEKIKTIGDAYLVVGGLPEPMENHAEAIAEMALGIRDELVRFNRQCGTCFSMRIGINTGPVIAGIIGRNKFIYDLWGDTVNLASRMESHAPPASIQVTGATYDLLRDKYVFEDRGEIEVKGRGSLKTHLLIGPKPASPDAGADSPIGD